MAYSIPSSTKGYAGLGMYLDAAREHAVPRTEGCPRTTNHMTSISLNSRSGNQVLMARSKSQEGHVPRPTTKLFLPDIRGQVTEKADGVLDDLWAHERVDGGLWEDGVQTSLHCRHQLCVGRRGTGVSVCTKLCKLAYNIDEWDVSLPELSSAGSSPNQRSSQPRG